MKKTPILTGVELLAKGATKIDTTLPELGLKDVIPNGSWLEQKQVQAAVEARKQLIEVERIEKRGVLSLAEWDDELCMAEVKQQTGGHWQYLGHHENKKLYLNPEEALYLMESNALHLKYNEVTVSLQQAYSLLLRRTITLLQYRVYSSLTRIGYKLVRHEEIKQKKNDNNLTEYEKKMNISGNSKTADAEVDLGVQNDAVENGDKSGDSESLPKNVVEDEVMETETVEQSPSNSNNAINEDNNVELICKPAQITFRKSNLANEMYSKKEIVKDRIAKGHFNTIFKDKVDKFFENVPEINQQSVVTIDAPSETYIPRNVFLNNTQYTLSIENIRNKPNIVSNDHRTYSLSDEVNDANIRRIRSDPRNNPLPNIWNPYQANRYEQTYFPYQQRQRHPNTTMFSLSFLQRSFMPQLTIPRFNFFPRNQAFFFIRPPRFSFNRPPSLISDITNDRNGRRNRRTNNSARQSHLESLKRLSFKIKQLLIRGNVPNPIIQSLHNLINTYNVRYETRVRLDSSFDLILDENIVETIDLDDDEEPRSKRPKNGPNKSSYEEYFNNIKQLVQRLKSLTDENMATARHRRAMSNMIKNFNKSYNADVYFNDDFEVYDRNRIILDSSESDCVVAEIVQETKIIGKKLRNPFSMLRQKSIENATTSDELTPNIDSNYEKLSKVFNENWLPKKDDFGRPEVVSKYRFSQMMRDYLKEEFVFDFLRDYKSDYQNWLDLKNSFWESLIDTNEIDDSCVKVDSEVFVSSLVKPEDCKDMASVLEKLQVIKKCEKAKSESSLVIDFDAYNRDVPNFKKSDKPKPHFRIICLDEHSAIPSGEDIEALCSKYKDDVLVVLAIVNVNSVCYIQMRSAEVPVYLPKSDVI